MRASVSSYDDALAAKLRVMVPELLELNGVLPAPVGDVPIDLIARLSPCRTRPDGRLRPEGARAAAPQRVRVRAPGQGRPRDLWHSPHTKRRFPADQKIDSRHTADGVLKQAGLDKAFWIPVGVGGS